MNDERSGAVGQEGDWHATTRTTTVKRIGGGGGRMDGCGGREGMDREEGVRE